MYSIGSLAKLSTTTVRTLRYYDEIGLLKPTNISDGGHRYYEEKEVTKLLYIKMLKEIGFPLTSIHYMLAYQNLDHKEALMMQLALLEKEKKEIEKRAHSIRYILQLSELEEITNWKDILKETSLHSTPTKLDVYEDLWRQHFSKDEITQLRKLPRIGDDGEQMQKYIALINDVRRSVDLDVKSPKAQELARRWVTLLEEAFNGDFQMAQKVWSTQKESNGTIGMYQLEEVIVNFIEKAIDHFIKVNY
ncbi:MerR family transcriptional regulator [Psychrobacillus vulpis]|uniref:MerR family transcriptional regulator n=1 Tax=Psychrobacillus vulpis TaxID=2325572 RepID=UPI001407F76D|nr:MerR family transcriptional regulator [Psychrobacillus vulpis]